MTGILQSITILIIAITIAINTYTLHKIAKEVFQDD